MNDRITWYPLSRDEIEVDLRELRLARERYAVDLVVQQRKLIFMAFIALFFAWMVGGLG